MQPLFSSMLGYYAIRLCELSLYTRAISASIANLMLIISSIVNLFFTLGFNKSQHEAVGVSLKAWVERS